MTRRVMAASALGLVLSGCALFGGCQSHERGEAQPTMAEPVSGWEDVKAMSRDGRYMFASQPTEGAIDRFAREGGAMVIDLRTHQGGDAPAFDEKLRVESQGMRYVHVPMSPKTFSSEDVERFARAIEQADGPVLVHCGTSNRVGGMWAAYLARFQGVAEEDAIRAGKAAGMRSEDVELAARRVISGG